MKKKNKIKKNLVQKYVSAVVTQCVNHKAYCDYKYYLSTTGLQSDDTLIFKEKECAMSDGNVEGLKDALRQYYSKYEIKLFTDAATLHYMNSYEDGDFDGVLDSDDGDDEDDAPDCEDDNKSPFDSTSQALYGRRYEEAKQSEKASDMQDVVDLAVESTAY